MVDIQSEVEDGHILGSLCFIFDMQFYECYLGTLSLVLLRGHA